MSRSRKVTKRTIAIDVAFHGSGAIEATKGGYRGGVADPNIGDSVQFEVWREAPDEDGVWNPHVGEATVRGGFQISIDGTSAGYRELARYLLAVAELDTSADPGFHEHHEMMSADGRTRLHLIVRKHPKDRPHKTLEP